MKLPVRRWWPVVCTCCVLIVSVTGCTLSTNAWPNRVVGGSLGTNDEYSFAAMVQYPADGPLPSPIIVVPDAIGTTYALVFERDEYYVQWHKGGRSGPLGPSVLLYKEPGGRAHELAPSWDPKLIEDSAAIRRFLEALLRKHGYLPARADSAE